MKEPFSSGYFTPLFITDQIQKRSHSDASYSRSHTEGFPRCQAQKMLYTPGTARCSRRWTWSRNAATKLWNRPDKCVAFPEHFQYRITHGLIGLHRQRIHTLHRILDRHLFPGGQSQQISVQNDITTDEPPADPRQDHSGNQSSRISAYSSSHKNSRRFPSSAKRTTERVKCSLRYIRRHYNKKEHTE